VRVTVGRIGADVGAAIASTVDTVDVRLVHVDLPLTGPGVESATGALRDTGFGYAAWLPGWAGHDVLRLQRLRDPTGAELAPDLYSPDARAMMADIRRELTSSG
jgi:hypothetical protein